MITYNLELITDELINEVTPILEKHRVELQSYDDMVLNVYWDRYRALEAQDKLVNLIARDEGEIVGYAVFFLHENPHYMDFMYAMQDVFYVTQDRRGSRVAINLVKKSEKILKAKGVSIITHHAKKKNKFAPFLERLGYSNTELLMAKRIDSED